MIFLFSCQTWAESIIVDFLRWQSVVHVFDQEMNYTVLQCACALSYMYSAGAVNWLSKERNFLKSLYSNFKITLFYIFNIFIKEFRHCLDGRSFICNCISAGRVRLSEPGRFENAVKSGAFSKRYGFTGRVNGAKQAVTIAVIGVISGLTYKRGERVNSALYWPFRLVCIPLKTKENLTAGSTPITANLPRRITTYSLKDKRLNDEKNLIKKTFLSPKIPVMTHNQKFWPN